jgi:hypothetical protein
MSNEIKMINMERIFNNLYRDLSNRESEEYLKKRCIAIEDNKEFKKLFFFYNRESHEYYYQSKDEDKVKEFLANNLDKDIIKDDDLFISYGEYLRKYENNEDGFEFNTNQGRIIIYEDNFYIALEEEFLNNDEFIQRLIKSENFNKEMIKIKKDCLAYLVQLSYDEIKSEIQNLTFEE